MYPSAQTKATGMSCRDSGFVQVVLNRPKFLSEVIDLRIRESPTGRTPFFFSFESSLLRAPFEPNLDGRRDSVTTSLQKPLAGPASIVQNGPARSQITIRDAEVKRAEIGRICGVTVN